MQRGAGCCVSIACQPFRGCSDASWGWCRRPSSVSAISSVPVCAPLKRPQVGWCGNSARRAGRSINRCPGCGSGIRCGRMLADDSSALVGLVNRDAEVAWHAHLEASIRADVSSKPSNSGEPRDESTHHKDAKHIEGTKAHRKRLRNTHGSGGLVKQVEDLLRQLLSRETGNTNSRKSRPHQFKAPGNPGAFSVSIL